MRLPVVPAIGILATALSAGCGPEGTPRAPPPDPPATAVAPAEQERDAPRTRKANVALPALPLPPLEEPAAPQLPRWAPDCASYVYPRADRTIPETWLSPDEGP